jgi:hypothetical protein
LDKFACPFPEEFILKSKRLIDVAFPENGEVCIMYQEYYLIMNCCSGTDILNSQMPILEACYSKAICKLIVAHRKYYNDA